MCNTTESTVGRGTNAERGSERAMSTAKIAVQRLMREVRADTHLIAAWRGSTRSAESIWFAGTSSRRSRAEVTPNGGFATNRNGRRGSRRSDASACTTMTCASRNRSRSICARCGCSSTATTRAPRSTSAAVIVPVPAPTSTTRSRARMLAPSTSCNAASSVSRYQPQRARVRSADTTHHYSHHGQQYRGGGAVRRTIYQSRPRNAFIVSRNCS